MATPKTIHLKGQPRRKELVAGGAITPGHLCMRNSAGKIVVHSTAGGNAQPTFAMENSIVGDTIDDAYASGDTTLYGYFQPGDEVYGLVAASASAIAIGDPLESAGDGTLRKHTPPSQAVDEGGSSTYTVTQYGDAVVAYAVEALDNSSGSSAARIRAEVK